MKKSNFIALLFGTVSIILFALGMCMTLTESLNNFVLGVIIGIIGIILGIITVSAWRKAENKKPLKINPKHVLTCVYAIIGTLILGTGMCMCMVWQNYILGTVIGTIGIIWLLFLIPITKGIK